MYYYDGEHGVFISTDELKRDYEAFKRDGYDKTLEYTSFQEYLELCHERNNGILVTATERYNECKRWLRFYVAGLKESLADCETDEEKAIVFEYGKDELETYIAELIEARAHL